MTTYLLLNLIFLATALLFLPAQLSKPRRTFWTTLIIVVVLTAVFDPLIIAFDIVDYNQSKILGLTVFGAPIEDFFYAVYACIIVPLIWVKLAPKESSNAR